MNETTAGAVAILGAAYPRQAFPTDSVRLYIRLLADLNPDALADAVARLIRRSTWLPSIAEIRYEVAEATLALPSVGEAWEQALIGRGMHDLVKRSYLASGGAWAFRTSERPEILRTQFAKDYEARRADALLVEIEAHPVPAIDFSDVEALPESTSIVPRPVWARYLRRVAGYVVTIPTEEEKHDAILVLQLETAGAFDAIATPAAATALHIEAQRILDDADRWMTHRLVDEEVDR